MESDNEYKQLEPTTFSPTTATCGHGHRVCVAAPITFLQRDEYDLPSGSGCKSVLHKRHILGIKCKVVLFIGVLRLLIENRTAVLNLFILFNS